MWVSGMAGWGSWPQGGREPEQREPIRPFLHTCAQLCEHTGSVCAWDIQAHEHTCSETTLVAPAHTVGRGWAGQASPDAVPVVCGGQLQGEASGHRWPRGQRLLLEDELGREVHLGGAHHDLSSREQGRLPFVVVLQHLGTGRGSWWWWRGDNHMWGWGSRPRLSGPTKLREVGRAPSPPRPDAFSSRKAWMGL